MYNKIAQNTDITPGHDTDDTMGISANSHAIGNTSRTP